jgi:predicted DNA-binding transcriptional regulator AlpA
MNTTKPETVPADPIRNRPEAAEQLGISESTLARLDKAGKGPPRIQISARRFGYRQSGLNAFKVQS